MCGSDFISNISFAPFHTQHGAGEKEQRCLLPMYITSRKARQEIKSGSEWDENYVLAFFFLSSRRLAFRGKGTEKTAWKTSFLARFVSFHCRFFVLCHAIWVVCVVFPPYVLRREKEVDECVSRANRGENWKILSEHRKKSMKMCTQERGWLALSSPSISNHHFPIIQRLSLLCSGCSIVLVVAIETHRYVQAEALCVSSDTT